MTARTEAQLSIAATEVEFAVNRRVLSNGIWSGFGEVADGPVDRRARLMVAQGTDGKLLGAAYMYACHCTTLGGDFNQISGDERCLLPSELWGRDEDYLWYSTGDAANADPVCSKSPDHTKVVQLVKQAPANRHIPIVFRSDAESANLHPLIQPSKA